MSNTLHDALEIDETAGIDPDEIEAIKRTLDRIKVLAAEFAKNNDAEDTTRYLKVIVQLLKGSRGLTVEEFVAFLSAAGSSGVGNKGALGAGTGRSAAQDADLQNKLNAAETQNATLLEDRKILQEIVLDLGLHAPNSTNLAFPADTARKAKAAVESKVIAATKSTGAAPADAVLKKDVSAKLTVIETAADDLKGPMGAKVNKTELKAAIDAAKALVK